MKKHSVRFTAVILFSAVFASCWAMNLERIDGSGDVVSETRSVVEFDRMLLKSSGDVVLKQGGVQSVEIETDDNIMPVIKTTVRDGRLVISTGEYNVNPTVLKYYITVENLNGITISGSGSVVGESRFVSNDFSAKINGSGDIALELDAKRLETRISGSGSMNLSGGTDFYEATINGSGEIEAFGMKSKRVSITINGSGDCRVSASEELTARISGSGEVIYKGRPRISSSISGSGAVKSRGAS